LELGAVLLNTSRETIDGGPTIADKPAGQTGGPGPGIQKPTGPLAWYRRRSTIVHTVTTLVLGAVVWQVVAANSSPLILVPLGDIWDALVTSVREGRLQTDFADSLQGFAIGFLIASVAGIAIGVGMAINQVVFDFLDPWMSALYSTPLIALAPLYIVTFGIGMTSRIAVVVTLAIFPVMLNTTAGIRTTDPNLVETARSFGANRGQVFTKILIPWSVPFIVTGLRLAVGRGLMGVVVAEFFGSTSGLGFRVFAASQNFDTPNVWLGVFMLAALGVIFIRLMHVIEKKVAPWRVSKTGRIL
jgi:ABC-type nitrate/sulfonate/bicarbonate transport system permease component